jgi:hypothetical protein
MNDVMELRMLINRVLLPRLRKLEDEVRTLRRHTWPYVQANKETSQLDDMKSKIEFMKNLEDEIICDLLGRKSRLSLITGSQGREYDIIKSHI